MTRASPPGPREKLRVKICGVKRLDEAILAAELGADFVGFNFYPPSPRYVEPGTAGELAAAVRGSGHGAKLVGVFVNASPAEVESVASKASLDLIQFHGDETAEDLSGVASRAIKVFRIRDRVEPGLVAGYRDVWGYLFDFRHPRLYGGTGESWDFSSLARLRDSGTVKPTFIAGGLGPDNVRAAVEASSPWGIDVCSGVEASPGRKDPELLRRLFDEVAPFRKETHHGPSPITP